MKKETILYWLPRLVAAIILLQTLFFKFTAHPDSVYIFSTLGLEPWGRIGIGVLELITGIALFIPRISVFAAVFAIGLMGGALMSHLTKLGIEINGDGGELFILAIVVALASAFIVIRERELLLRLIRR